MAPIQLTDPRRRSLATWHRVANFLFNGFRFPGSRKLYRSVSKRCLPALKDRTFVPTIFGFDLVVGPDNAYDYYYLGFYEMGALNVFRQVLKPGDVFLDVGANIGLMSFYASTLVGPTGRVYAFEPTQRYFDDLSSGIRKNGFGNIVPLQFGLGSKEEDLPIYHNQVCPSLIQTSSADPSEIIHIKTLDGMVGQHALDRVRLIKIDVEGFEVEVVSGGSTFLGRPDAPVLCIEYVRDQQMITRNGQTALDLVREINDYRWFQLERSSDTLGRLIEVGRLENLHANDNVFCLLDRHCEQYAGLIRS